MKSMDFDFELGGGMIVAIVNQKPYMFTNMRIDRSTIPEGYYAYDVRESDGGAGDFAQVQSYVMVNHWGTIIGKDEIPMDEKWGCYFCTEDDGEFTDDYVRNLKEFEEVRNDYRGYVC